MTVLAYLPWAGGWWSITAPDTYGLRGQWNEVSGSIMGFGNGSQASFTKTSLQTLVNGYSCLAPYTAQSCSASAGTLFNSTALAPGAVAYYSGVTAESNNLVPTIGAAPQHEPQINCIDATWCQDNYDVSAP